MPDKKLTSICFTARFVHSLCLDTIFEHTEVKALIINGPPLTPLPFLRDCKQYALSHNIAVYEDKELSTEEIEKMATETDIGLSVGFGTIIQERQFLGPSLGTFNLHPSELPAYRGMHPVIYAIMNGEKNVGITLHRITAGIDTGPIVFQSNEPVTEYDSIYSITDKIYTRGAKLLEQLLVKVKETGYLSEQKQYQYNELINNRRVIQWNDSAWRINNLIRSLTYPWPMAKTFYKANPLLISTSNIINDNQINPGLIMDISSTSITVGTGGQSIKITEIRDHEKKIIPFHTLQEKLNLIPLKSRLGQ